MADDAMDNIPKYLAGFKGPVVFNGAMSRLTPLLTFKDGLPAEQIKMMNLSQPSKGQMTDPWVIRRPNAKIK